MEDEAGGGGRDEGGREDEPNFYTLGGDINYRNRGGGGRGYLVRTPDAGKNTRSSLFVCDWWI